MKLTVGGGSGEVLYSEALIAPLQPFQFPTLGSSRARHVPPDGPEHGQTLSIFPLPPACHDPIRYAQKGVARSGFGMGGVTWQQDDITNSVMKRRHQASACGRVESESVSAVDAAATSGQRPCGQASEAQPALTCSRHPHSGRWQTMRDVSQLGHCRQISRRCAKTSSVTCRRPPTAWRTTARLKFRPRCTSPGAVPASAAWSGDGVESGR